MPETNVIRLCKDNHVEGLLVHTNRSCKLWSGFMPEMSRQIGEACGILVVSFDGDQADPRNFSEAQYDTRVQGLTGDHGSKQRREIEMAAKELLAQLLKLLQIRENSRTNIWLKVRRSLQ